MRCDGYVGPDEICNGGFLEGQGGAILEDDGGAEVFVAFGNL